MGNLFLVRHGQASLGADDYDKLSPLGERQARRLGEHWAQRGQRFDAVYTGTLRRHAQTLAGIAEGMGQTLEAARLEGLNEYDSHALIRCLYPEPQPRPDTPEARRLHFRRLCDALSAWMAGTIAPEGMPSWADFSAGVRSSLDMVRSRHVGHNVLMVSSGGPISTAVAQVMGSEPGVMIGLNMRLRNSALTEFGFSAKRHSLQTFNTLPHLNDLQYEDWISLA
jgi:broad specificity phosphatase PhoE